MVSDTCFYTISVGARVQTKMLSQWHGMGERIVMDTHSKNHYRTREVIKTVTFYHQEIHVRTDASPKKTTHT